MNQFARIVKEKRAEFRMTQQNLAELIETSRTTINLIENERQKSSLRMAVDIAIVLNISLDSLKEYV